MAKEAFQFDISWVVIQVVNLLRLLAGPVAYHDQVSHHLSSMAAYGGLLSSGFRQPVTPVTNSVKALHNFFGLYPHEHSIYSTVASFCRPTAIAILKSSDDSAGSVTSADEQASRRSQFFTTFSISHRVFKGLFLLPVEMGKRHNEVW